MRVTQKELDQAYVDFGANYGGPKEDYFALLYLMRKFKLPREEAALQVAFGGNDYGFDAFHFDREARSPTHQLSYTHEIQYAVVFDARLNYRCQSVIHEPQLQRIVGICAK